MTTTALLTLLAGLGLAQTQCQAADIAPAEVPAMAVAPAALIGRPLSLPAALQAPLASAATIRTLVPTMPSPAGASAANPGSWTSRSVALRRQMLKEVRPWAPLRYEEDEPDGEGGEPGQGSDRGPVTQSVDDSLDALKMQLLHPINRLYPAVLHPDQPSAEELSWELNDILAEQKERVPERDLVPPRLRERTMAFLDAVGMTIGVRDDEETLEDYQKRLIAGLERASTAIRDAASESALDVALYGKPEPAAARPAGTRAKIAFLACAAVGTAIALIGAHLGHPTAGFLTGLGAGALVVQIIRRV